MYFESHIKVYCHDNQFENDNSIWYSKTIDPTIFLTHRFSPSVGLPQPDNVFFWPKIKSKFDTYADGDFISFGKLKFVQDILSTNYI